MRKVLIAVDGSEVAAHAARFAGTLLPPDEEVIVLTVVDDGALVLSRAPLAGWGAAPLVPMAAPATGGFPMIGLEADPGLRSEAGDAGREITRDAATELPQQAETAVEFSGDVAGSILDVADREGVDLIVMGLTQASGISRWFHKSTAEHVVRDARCAVLVVPAPQT